MKDETRNSSLYIVNRMPLTKFDKTYNFLYLAYLQHHCLGIQESHLFIYKCPATKYIKESRLYTKCMNYQVKNQLLIELKI